VPTTPIREHRRRPGPAASEIHLRRPHGIRIACGWLAPPILVFTHPQHEVRTLSATLVPYLHLAIAILTEVAATSALRASNGFTRFWPSVVVIVGYGICFLALSLCVRRMPIGVAYGIWSGIGIVLITIAGWYLYRQRIDGPAMIGMGLIIAGVLVIQVFSRTKTVDPPSPDEAPHLVAESADEPSVALAENAARQDD